MLVELHLERLKHIAMMPPKQAFVSLETVQMQANGSNVDAASHQSTARTPTVTVWWRSHRFLGHHWPLFLSVVELYLERSMRLAMLPTNPAFVSMKTVQMRPNDSMLKPHHQSTTRTPTVHVTVETLEGCVISLALPQPIT